MSQGDWQSSVERDKAAIARDLHDHHGGLLAAAIMDVTWSEMHLSTNIPEVRLKLGRAHDALNVAIDLNRRLIEELRPTLLDNFGLMAALKWHFTGTCEAAEIACEQQYPEPLPEVPSRTGIALYRIAQTILSLLVTHHSQRVSIAISTADDRLTMRLSGHALREACTPNDDTTRDALSSVYSRVRAFAGSMSFQMPEDGVKFEFECTLDAAPSAVSALP